MKTDSWVRTVMVIGILSLILAPIALAAPIAKILVGTGIIIAATTIMLIGMHQVNKMEFCQERTQQRAEVLLIIGLWSLFVLIVVIIFLPRILKLIAT